jgi:hypothetical protein
MYDQMMRNLFIERVTAFKEVIDNLPWSEELSLKYRGKVYSGEESHGILSKWKQGWLERIGSGGEDTWYVGWGFDMLNSSGSSVFARTFSNGDEVVNKIVMGVFFDSESLFVCKAVIKDMYSCLISWVREYFDLIKECFGNPEWVKTQLLGTRCVLDAQEILCQLGLSCSGYTDVRDFVGPRINEVVGALVEQGCHFSVVTPTRRALEKSFFTHVRVSIFSNYDTIVRYLLGGQGSRISRDFMIDVLEDGWGVSVREAGIDRFLIDFLCTDYFKKVRNVWQDSVFASLEGSVHGRL